MNIVRIITQILAVGLPPALENEIDLRSWLSRLCDAMKAIAALTSPHLDDRLMEILDKMIVDDDYWKAGYAIILALTRILPDDYLDEPRETALALTESPDSSIDTTAAVLAGDDPRLDPVTIVTIIIQLLTFIREWRKR